jgi:uncharacterized membrane protein
MAELRDRVLAWSRDGSLAPAHVDQALRIAGVTPGAAQSRAFVERALLWLGAVLVAAAMAYFVAANWQALGRYGKFALAEAALVLAVALAWWRGLDDLAGRAALFAAAILTGVLLALVGQVYQTGADTFELFATWAIFIVPWAMVGRQPALWMLVVWLADIAIVFYFRMSVARGFDALDLVFASRLSLWWVTAFNVAALIAWETATARRHGWWSVRWDRTTFGEAPGSERSQCAAAPPHARTNTPMARNANMPEGPIQSANMTAATTTALATSPASMKRSTVRMRYAQTMAAAKAQ